MNPKKIITEEMLANMEMLAVTNPGMLDALEQAKVIYALNGSPNFFEDEDEDDDYDLSAEDIKNASECWDDEGDMEITK